MKNVFLICFLILSFSAFGQSQKELESSLENLRLALISPDDATLLRLTSQSLTYGHSSGAIENQSEFIDALKNGPAKFVSIQVSDQKIEIVDKVAWVRQNLSGDVKTGEAMSKLNLGVLYVWVSEKGTWKLLARQAFKR